MGFGLRCGKGLFDGGVGAFSWIVTERKGNEVFFCCWCYMLRVRMRMRMMMWMRVVVNRSFVGVVKSVPLLQSMFVLRLLLLLVIWV